MIKHKKYIDFRSDTVTNPTLEMREAIFNAELGDDVLQEDPTVKKLEKLAAQMLGKEAALFVPSGTFGNQLALFTHCKRGDEVILSDMAHIVQHEVGAASIIAGVQLRTIHPKNSWLTWNEIEKVVRKQENIHYPDTGLIVLLNSLSNGDVKPLEVMKEIYENAKKYNIPVHIDGARIFNAATYLNVDVKQIAKYSDSVMFCLSKGLVAPIGSILVGTNEFIAHARKKRKLMGGGMRQVGIIAAAGIIALTKMTKRLDEDHQNAKKLALAFDKYALFELDIEKVKTNIFFMKLNPNNSVISNKFLEIFTCLRNS